MIPVTDTPAATMVDGTTLRRAGDAIACRVLAVCANAVRVEASQVTRVTMWRPDGIPAIVAHRVREERPMPVAEMVRYYGRDAVVAALAALPDDRRCAAALAGDRGGAAAPDSPHRGMTHPADTPPHLTSPLAGPQAARGGEGHENTDPQPPEAA